MKLSIVTSPKHSHLGWGTKPEQVEHVAQILREVGIEAKILGMNFSTDLSLYAPEIKGNLVWPNAYHLGDQSGKLVSLPQQLHQMEGKIVGPNSKPLELVLNKGDCQSALQEKGIPTPKFISVNGQGNSTIQKQLEKAKLTYPVIVKSATSSLSRGVFPDCVQETPESTIQYIKRLREEEGHPELIVEEYLTGEEFTVAVLGSNGTIRPYPVAMEILDPTVKGRKYAFMDAIMREGGALKNGRARTKLMPNAQVTLDTLAKNLCAGLGISDWTRFDGRFDSKGNPKVFDVNGMPGLSVYSAITDLLSHHYPTVSKEDLFKGVVYSIVHSAATRHGITPPRQLTNNALYLN